MKVKGDSINGWNSVLEYHKKEQSASNLMIIELNFNHKKDGNVIEKVNQLIREGWELVYIETFEDKVFAQTIKFKLLRWIA